MILFLFLVFSLTFKLSSQLLQQHRMNFSSQVISTYILTIIQIYTHNSSSLFSTMLISLNMSIFLLIRLVTHLILSSLQKTQLYHPQLYTHSLVSPSDHFPIFTSIVISPPSPPPLTKHFFRCIKSINLNNFIRDKRTSQLAQSQFPSTITSLCDGSSASLTYVSKTERRE